MVREGTNLLGDHERVGGGVHAGSPNDGRTAVILLNWNGEAYTVPCLESLYDSGSKGFDIVVVDNASRRESLAAVAGWAEKRGVPHLRMVKPVGGAVRPCGEESPAPAALGMSDGPGQLIVIECGENLGFCAGNNLGVLTAYAMGYSRFLVLNNDTEVEAGFLEPLVAYAEAHPESGLLGGMICYWDDRGTIWYGGGEFGALLRPRRLLSGGQRSVLEPWRPRPVDWVSGCMMMMTRQTIEKVGLFDESYFIWAEEWDYSVRVARAGFALTMVPSSVVYHKVGRALGVMHPLSYYFGIRNQLYFRKKHLPFWKFAGFVAGYLPGRAVRFLQLAVSGRPDLAKAGLLAVWDFLQGRTGKGRYLRGE